MTNKEKIFKNSSTTYYYSSLFFPKGIREQVQTLYAFVRIADNFVDSQDQEIEAFLDYEKQSYKALAGQKITGSPFSKYIQDFANLAIEKKFDLKWIRAFFDSMRSDFNQKSKKIIYQDAQQLDKYIYGSAETIGLMMSRILGLDSKADQYAQALGYAMQHINFIRDIKEDCILNRQYLPFAKLEKFNLQKLCSTKIEEIGNSSKFRNFIKKEINLYFEKLRFAEKGFSYIPYRYRIPIKTASDLYIWTAKKIYQDPGIVLIKKVKPTKTKVIQILIRNVFRCLV